MERRVIARWESISGKHWLECFEFYNPPDPAPEHERLPWRSILNGDCEVIVGYGYSYASGGGGFGDTADTREAAIEICERNIAPMIQPDRNKTPLRRVV